MVDDKESGNPTEDNSQVDGKDVDTGHGGAKDNGEPEMDENALQEATEKLHREGEARAQALTLELLGDLPHAEVKPPEHVLFVCKLNPVTEDEDLDLIFSRFGKILSCEVIRDKRTGESLQYAFIEFEHRKDCEQAYLKMQGVLIDDHRIHVDFSQSVSRLSDTWRKATNLRRAQLGGGYGGVSNLEKKRHYRAAEEQDEDPVKRSGRYGMIFDKEEIRNGRNKGSSRDDRIRFQQRSRSPRKHDRIRERSPPYNHHGQRREADRSIHYEAHERSSRRRW